MLERHRLERDMRLERVVSVVVISMLAAILCLTSAYLTQDVVFAILYSILGIINAAIVITGIFSYRKIKSLYQ